MSELTHDEHQPGCPRCNPGASDTELCTCIESGYSEGLKRWHGSQLTGRPPDGVRAPRPRPDDLECDPHHQDAQEDRLFEAADQSAPEGGLDEREEGQRQPTARGDETVGVAAAPEVECA